MIQPILKDDALVADIESADPSSLHLWWLGQSGFLVKFGSQRIVLDPYLSDSLTAKYAETDKPHVRMTERVVAPARLTGISLVTASHNHTDHLDAETLLPLLAENPDAALCFPAANTEFVSNRLGGLPTSAFGLEIWQRAEVGGIPIQAVPAAHDELSPAYAGFVLEIGGTTVYHSGDTLWYTGMEMDLLPLWIDIALLPINGSLPERRVSGNLWGDEAAKLAKAIGAKLVVPCHYEMFTFNTETPALFEATCAQLEQPFRTLRAGERLTFPDPL